MSSDDSHLADRVDDQPPAEDDLNPLPPPPCKQSPSLGHNEPPSASTASESPSPNQSDPSSVEQNIHQHLLHHQLQLQQDHPQDSHHDLQQLAQAAQQTPPQLQHLQQHQLSHISQQLALHQQQQQSQQSLHQQLLLATSLDKDKLAAGTSPQALHYQNAIYGAIAESAGSAGKPPVGSDEWLRLRRENHKEVERRRRETINDGINELAKLIPEGEKNKGRILNRAVQYIIQLKEQEQSNLEKWTLEKLLCEQAIQELSTQVDNLKNENEQLRAAMAAMEETPRKRSREE
ncbi:uncharacterized protein BJ171DRAFT_507952 [Polychytrium aggregatum]|uniref:uncharacterized protein n=1 Tax=Polychytrium aggregatum TaxID=110093 RepID=UPI0022FF0760|nr:uncharacterized protein BJ171DRAFT_507952 [Polychytrium aggregatum]KAI9203789.1 hypothetical protein BJ171DRAFT_507952 [Polychytrium aggregatum]